MGTDLFAIALGALSQFLALLPALLLSFILVQLSLCFLFVSRILRHLDISVLVRIPVGVRVLGTDHPRGGLIRLLLLFYSENVILELGRSLILQRKHILQGFGEDDFRGL